MCNPLYKQSKLVAHQRGLARRTAVGARAQPEAPRVEAGDERLAALLAPDGGAVHDLVLDNRLLLVDGHQAAHHLVCRSYPLDAQSVVGTADVRIPGKFWAAVGRRDAAANGTQAFDGN